MANALLELGVSEMEEERGLLKRAPTSMIAHV